MEYKNINVVEVVGAEKCTSEMKEWGKAN